MEGLQIWYSIPLKVEMSRISMKSWHCCVQAEMCAHVFLPTVAHSKGL